MLKVIVIYYSRTGNTEKMAESIVEGVRNIGGVDVNLMLDFEVTSEDLLNSDAIIVGIPTYHHDMTRSMKKLFEKLAIEKINLKGKIGASFGSYGWSGEAPRLILEIMENKFEMKVLKPPLLIKNTPDKNDLEKCYSLGREVAEQISSF